MTLKLDRALVVVEIQLRAKFHQAKCSGLCVINSALDFGQLNTSIANISGTDEAIDKQKTALLTTILSTFDESNLANYGPLTKKMTLTFDLTLKFNRVL